MRYASLIIAVFLPLTAFALLPEEQLANPADETRARHLATELRCLVCQNQSVDESDADFAITIRSIIREQITAQKSDAEIRTYLRQRYGDYILYAPPLRGATLLLWGAPLLLLIGGIILIIATRRRPSRPRRRQRKAP